MLNFENLDKAIYPGVGKYDMPEILPVGADFNVSAFDWVPYDKAYKVKDSDMQNTGIHFFIDDQFFTCLWNRPSVYTGKLRQFGAVCSPDFSMYTNTPRAVWIYNNYRRQWLARYWQENGVTVIPAVGWVDKESFDWCFDGKPRHSVIAISSLGTQEHRESKKLFAEGVEETLKRLEPTQILWYGKIPDQFSELKNVVRVPTRWEQLRNGVLKKENG